MLLWLQSQNKMEYVMYFTLILKVVVFSFESIGFRKQFLWFDIIHCDAPIAAFSGLNNRKNQDKNIFRLPWECKYSGSLSAARNKRKVSPPPSWDKFCTLSYLISTFCPWFEQCENCENWNGYFYTLHWFSLNAVNWDPCRHSMETQIVPWPWLLTVKWHKVSFYW